MTGKLQAQQNRVPLELDTFLCNISGTAQAVREKQQTPYYECT